MIKYLCKTYTCFLNIDVTLYNNNDQVIKFAIGIVSRCVFVRSKLMNKIKECKSHLLTSSDKRVFSFPLEEVKIYFMREKNLFNYLTLILCNYRIKLLLTYRLQQKFIRKNIKYQKLYKYYKKNIYIFKFVSRICIAHFP